MKDYSKTKIKHVIEFILFGVPACLCVFSIAMFMYMGNLNRENIRKNRELVTTAKQYMNTVNRMIDYNNLQDADGSDNMDLLIDTQTKLDSLCNQ